MLTVVDAAKFPQIIDGITLFGYGHFYPFNRIVVRCLPIYRGTHRTIGVRLVHHIPYWIIRIFEYSIPYVNQRKLSTVE